MSRDVYQLKITLVGIAPQIWRRILVPGGFTLDRLGRVIRLSFGWYGDHLHNFEIAGRQYGCPGPLDEPGLLDELDFRLDAVAGVGGKFGYIYDFGDWWEHEIVVESVTPADPDKRYPTCVDGERAGPPEGVGGPAGYSRLLAARRDPTVGGPMAGPDLPDGFDPTRCDAAAVSTLLRRMT